ncbi:MAG: DNA alkylation repair protein [Anaerolineales bacterium]
MMEDKQEEQLTETLLNYDPQKPRVTAEELRDLWLQFDPKSIEVIKASLREQQETIGIPVPILKSIGKEIGKKARNQVDDYLPLIQLLWDEYGREGRVVATIPMGVMELTSPEKVVPLLREMCRTCLTWEDADRLAMDALEPIVRKKPEEWLSAPESWLDDENKWVRRAGVIVIGRLPLKRPDYAKQCLGLIERLLYDEDEDVKKAVSFAIRLVARGEIGPVHELLKQYVPPENPAATWVLCDVIRSMPKGFLAEVVDLLPLYEEWNASESLTTRERLSIQSAIKTLKKAIE